MWEALEVKYLFGKPFMVSEGQIFTYDSFMFAMARRNLIFDKLLITNFTKTIVKIQGIY